MKSQQTFESPLRLSLLHRTTKSLLVESSTCGTVNCCAERRELGDGYGDWKYCRANLTDDLNLHQNNERPLPKAFKPTVY
jgi:hypothetical protein